jgi:hypothetical protein
MLSTSSPVALMAPVPVSVTFSMLAYLARVRSMLMLA